MVRKSDRPIRTAAAAGTAGWVAVLALTGSLGPVAELADLFASVLPPPKLVSYVPTLATGGALSAAGALLVSRLWPREKWTGIDRRKPHTEEAGDA